MPDPSGNRDIGAAFSDQLKGSVSLPSSPFGLSACPGGAWVITLLAAVGVLAAFGFAMFSDGGGSGGPRGNSPVSGSAEFQDAIDEAFQEALREALEERR